MSDGFSRNRSKRLLPSWPAAGSILRRLAAPTGSELRQEADRDGQLERPLSVARFQIPVLIAHAQENRKPRSVISFGSGALKSTALAKLAPSGSTITPPQR
jgi:hypothetical protein